MQYRVIDTKTGDTVRLFATCRLANRYADKLNLEYGAYRYISAYALEVK